MKALRVTQGEQSWTLALEHDGVLSAIVNCIQNTTESVEDCELRMFGLDTHTDTHLRWNPVTLSVGDQVTIEVIENCQGDEPDHKEPKGRTNRLEQRKQFLRDEAAAFGWTLIEQQEITDVSA